LYIIVIIYYFILIYSELFLDKAFFDDYYESDTEKHFDKLAFSITFSEKEWELIKPRPKLYNDKKYSRKYLVLSPYEWSNIVQKHFFYILVYHVPFYLKKQNFKIREIYL